MTEQTPHAGNTEALGESEAFLAFQARLSDVSSLERPVLIVGERGTGKELAARRLHFLSRRWDGPLVTLNCAALPPTLIESELFGHEPGAFTGASARRAGRFEAANGGTLFLDEIGTIPLVTQEKILRAAEYGTFEPLGSSETIVTNARIVAATNADLRAAVRNGRFKADLLDRLAFEVLIVPPLRERAEDVELLTHHFASRMAMELRLEEMVEFAPEAMAVLQGHRWPGNVRELKNVVERAVYRAAGAVVTAESIVLDPFAGWHTGSAPPERQPAAADGSRASSAAGDRLAWLRDQPLEEAVERVEVALLREALREARYHQGRAADALGLTYDQFRSRYRKYKEHLAGDD